MEKIDLLKCNNCRFKAEISNSGPVSGRIVVDKGVYLVDEKGDIIGFLSLDGEEIMSMSGCGITDFEIVPRDPETYQDWQVGDKVATQKGGLQPDKEVIFRSGELVICKYGNNNNIGGGYTCVQLFQLGYRLVLTDIEERIIAEKKKYEPQEGDIVAWKDKEDEGRPAISIYREKDWSYMTLFTTGICCVNEFKLSMKIVRPATEEEKQRLFDAMAKNGKRWNAEKKVVEDIPKPYEFKKGEPVLVRNYSDSKWRLSAFLRKSGSGYVAVSATLSERDCFTFTQCIPYNEKTMHLLGTSEDYKEGV